MVDKYITYAVIGSVIFFTWCIFIGCFNHIKRSEQKVKEGESGIVVALQKRYSVLMQMAKIVREYAGYEKNMLVDLVNIRQGNSLHNAKQTDSQLQDAAKEILALAENYPELKSSKNYLKLQDAIQEAEDHLQAARRLYNANVSEYNGSIASFPGNMIAGFIGARMAEYYSVDTTEFENIPL